MVCEDAISFRKGGYMKRKAILFVTDGILGFLAGFYAGIWRITRKVDNGLIEYEKNQHRFESNADLMNIWIKKLHDGKSLATLCKTKNYQKVAIYGMNYVGERVLEELIAGQIVVSYGIDKAAHSIKSDIKVVTPDSSLEQVDAVIVTPIYYYEDIKSVLQRKITYPILSLEHMIYEL